jgi:hypothetical protein
MFRNIGSNMRITEGLANKRKYSPSVCRPIIFGQAQLAHGVRTFWDTSEATDFNKWSNVGEIAVVGARHCRAPTADP